MHFIPANMKAQQGVNFTTGQQSKLPVSANDTGRWQKY
jgi:hypothetical protein